MPSGEKEQYAFMHARLDEDEAAANAVYGWWRAHGDRAIADESYAAILIADVDPETRAFILRFDPARELREVEAKRAIVAMNETPEEHYEPNYYWALWQAFLAIASVYEDHPDYGRLFG